MIKMQATYTMKKDELTYEFLDNLKKLISGEQIVLHIESFDKVEDKLNNISADAQLFESIKNAEAGKNLIEVDFNEILKTANEKD